MGAKKHTTINLDMDLVSEAQRELGTANTTETVHRALKEAINLEKRKQLLRTEFPGLTLESLRALREERDFLLPIDQGRA